MLVSSISGGNWKSAREDDVVEVECLMSSELEDDDEVVMFLSVC